MVSIDFALEIIGLESGASFLEQSNHEVRQNQHTDLTSRWKLNQNMTFQQ